MSATASNCLQSNLFNNLYLWIIPVLYNVTFNVSTKEYGPDNITIHPWEDSVQKNTVEYLHIHVRLGMDFWMGWLEAAG